MPPAAIGAAVPMVCAIIMRLRRHGRLTYPGDVFYLCLAVFVAWGRLGPEPFGT